MVCLPQRSLKGFTLLELIGVLGVLAILSALAIGAVRGAHQRANIERARGELAALVTALENYKRHYGDYPWLGTPGFNQATPLLPTATTTGPGTSSVQSKLFNCLTGVFGPKAFASSDRVNGPNFLDVGKFTVNGTLTATTFLVPVVASRGAPPVKQEQNVGLVDPWGRYYVYYYKSPSNPGAWQAPAYVLYSAGPTVAASGSQTPPINTSTGLTLATQTAEMLDNIFANP